MPVQISKYTVISVLTLGYILVTILATACTYKLVYAHFAYLHLPISLLHACELKVFLNASMHGQEGVGSGIFLHLSMSGTFCWCEGLCFGRDRDHSRDFVFYTFLLLRVLGWWVGVCMYTRVHTHRLHGYLM